jgi:death-on-curing protein
VSKDILFLRQHEVLALHAQLIQVFGGLATLRDEAALESALVAPAQRTYYETASLAACAATYAYHLTQAHAFVDGNKRVAAAATELFLELNGARFQATDEEVIDLFLRIAAGTLTRAAVEQIIHRWVIVDE